MVSYLRFYSRKDVQKKILEASKDREVAFKFGDKGFGKRPDVLQFEGDVFEMAKQGVTSFHVSEERWSNPLDLKTGMVRKQLDELRTGWDLILDVDGPFELSKITTQLLIEALKFYDIENLTLKFSGNKGFHIGIPFESFPDKVHNQNTKDLFPDGPRKIASHLTSFIKEKLRESMLKEYSIKDISKMSGKQEEDIQEKKCKICGSKVDERVMIQYGCKCGQNEESYSERPLECPQCKNKREIKKKKVLECPDNKDHKDFESVGELNPFSVVDIDTILIASRHMFRAPYSINEKSGLVSIPVDPSKLNEFKKDHAKPENVEVKLGFLNTEKIPDASRLILQAFDKEEGDKIKTEIKKRIQKGMTVDEAIYSETFSQKERFSTPAQPIQPDFFPPCILKILEGIKEDGRKRSLFILINFLKSSGWNMNEVQDLVCNKWNKNNYEPLPEGYVLSQISWHKKQSKSILPPNCDNKSYYNDLRLCSKDGLCGKVKNPINYAMKKLRLLSKAKKSSKS